MSQGHVPYSVIFTSELIAKIRSLSSVSCHSVTFLSKLS